MGAPFGITDHAIERYRERIDPTIDRESARALLERLALSAKYGRIDGIHASDEHWSAGDVVFVVRCDRPGKRDAVTVLARPRSRVVEPEGTLLAHVPHDQRELIASRRSNALRTLDEWRDGGRVKRLAAERAAALLEIELPARARALPDLRPFGREEDERERNDRLLAIDIVERWSRGEPVRRVRAEEAAARLRIDLPAHGAWRVDK